MTELPQFVEVFVWSYHLPFSKRLWVRIPQVELIFLSFFLSFLLTIHSSNTSFSLPGTGSGARIADNSEVIQFVLALTHS